MPPHPSLRRSPSMEPRADIHKRGRSLESGLSFKEKDDDLALFNEMQIKEAEKFLLQSTDDFEEIFSSKGKSFLDLRLEINIPARGETSDLLTVQGDKNDYDWLLTPPDTPLFPSLDEEPASVNVVHKGRAQSRPISISRSSTMERRSSRGSPSPQRLSPSPRSGTSTFRGRSSSAPHTTSVPLRPSTPSQRASPPLVKPSTSPSRTSTTPPSRTSTTPPSRTSTTPPPRTSTPPPRRSSTGSSTSVITPGLRGTSPARTSLGNSASPKIRAWQSNIPGFSLEAPPNLRTSLADRPTSYVRGSSPASRARNSSGRVRRQSMSPTASRSISSSHSQERDRLSTHSKGSVKSSGDDDTDSLQSIPMNITGNPMSKRGVSSISNSKPSAFSKKPSKTFSPSSAPKRSFDSAMRQMERKSPPSMFRPLLSSVPSSTFYAGKASPDCHDFMRNSTVITSSNASSDLATCGAHDTEGCDQYQDDMSGESARAPFSDIQDEMFAIDEINISSKDIRHGATNIEPNVQLGAPDRNASSNYDSKQSVLHLLAMSTDSNFGEINGSGKVFLCSICSCLYQSEEVTESEHNICTKCKQNLSAQHISVSLMKNAEDSIILNPNLVVPQLHIAMDTTHERNISGTPINEGEKTEAENFSIQLADELRTVYNPSHGTNDSAEMNKGDDKFDSNINVTEGQGISVLLLKRSGSLKGPLIHGRTLNSSVMSYDDLFSARDLTSSMRSSVAHGSISTSSSMDLAMARHREVLVQRELSGRRSDTSSKPQSSGSCQGFVLSTSSHEGSDEGSVSNMQHIVAEENVELQNSVPSVYASVSEEYSKKNDVSVMHGCMENTKEDNSWASIDVKESHDLHKIVNLEKNVNVECVLLETTLAEETTMPDNRIDEIEFAEDPRSSSHAMSEKVEDGSHPNSPREDLEDADALLDKDVIISAIDPCESDHADGIVDESTVMVEGEGKEGRRTRSLTLEEATVLFCSSIIHDIVYKAASIAIEIEKENLEPLEVARPTITIPENRSSGGRETRGATRKMKPQNARKACSETESKSPTNLNETANEPVVRPVGLPNNVDGMKPPKLESKCNCTIM